MLFRSKDNVYDAVDAVTKHGFAAIDESTTHAVRYADRIIKCLEPYSDIKPVKSYKNTAIYGYLYYVYDGNKFSDSQVKELLE